MIHRRCWTADRLARRNLPHPSACPLCEQQEETIDHLLTGCVFARQFWFILLGHFNLQGLAPTNEDEFFDSWWQKESQKLSGKVKKGFNSLVILGSWSLWKHRNNRVFDGGNPSLERALVLAKEEAFFWSLAGAKGISFLAASQQA